MHLWRNLIIWLSNFLVTDVVFQPIEFLGWDCLTIGALGWGQIQIANTNKITIRPGYSRKRWMIEFCERLATFYPKEIQKIINERLTYFETLKAEWEQRQD